MAFENQMIASMNNPNAVAAWREASRQDYWRAYHAARATNLADHIETLHANASHARRIHEQVQRALLASREENRAVHAELGEMHEVQQSALTLASTYMEAYFEQRTRACRAERRAFDYGAFAFTLVALQSLGVWIGLLAWLP